MANHSAQEPLLSKNEDVELISIQKKTSNLSKSLAKWTLKSVMWMTFITWATFIFFFPTSFVNDYYFAWVNASQDTIFGTAGSVFMIFCAPILVIAFLAVVHLIISGEEEIYERKNSKHPRFRFWTFPVLVDGPLGVVSAGEMIGIIIFVVFIITACVLFTIMNYNLLRSFGGSSKEISLLMIEFSGLRLGFIGMVCLAFLFLPVARGSILLRVIDIPFEHAARYHVWLGHLTMFIFTIHGLCFVFAWTVQGRLLQQLMEWENIGVANLPGVIALVAGLLMWVTSLPQVRRINFELFFYTHQLYVVFVIFLALHVGDFIFNIAAAGIFLFMLDRFLRFWQSRKTVDVVSATCFPCGTLELVLSKPSNLRYNALGWSFLQIRELSWLQWHPFSVSSSPLDGKYHMSFLIKVLGNWTAKLKEQISSISEKESKTELQFKPNSLTVSVEGPYGHESPYHLEYENLILVAGGIGISPFLAILSDVLHRLGDGKPCLPKNILIIWAVKKTDELPLLQTVDMESICPSFSDKLNLEIQTYVTRESGPSLEEGKVQKHVISSISPASTGCKMSPLVGTGSVVWSGLYLLISTIGLAITVALLNVFYVNPFNVTYWWYKGLLFLACMVVSVLVFGGLVIVLWHFWEMKSKNESEDSEKFCSVQQNGYYEAEKISGQEQYTSSILYGQRPDFGEIFRSMAERWGNVDIGVIVCGPSTLQTSVAKECRTKNFNRRTNQPIFHFNSHSFDL